MNEEMYVYEFAKNQLEEIIDLFGVSDTAYTLATICHEKAAHARANFNNEIIAKSWERIADKIAGLASDV